MPDNGFRIASAFVEVAPDTEGFRERLQAALDEAIAGARADVPIGADLSDLEAKLQEAREKIDDFKSSGATATLGADTGDLDSKVDDAKAKLDDLDGREARAVLTADDADLDAKADSAKAKLDDLDGKEARAKLGLDKTAFDAEMDDAEARLAAFKASSASASLGGSGGSGAGGAGGLGEGAGEGGGFGGMLAMLGGGLATMLPGVGGAATGMGMLAGVGALGLGGIFKAVDAAHQAATSIGMSSQQLASTEFSNSVQIRQAQQQVASAHMQAAQDAVQAAEQITQSQMALAETERNAAAQQIAAEQAVGQAEHELADSQFTEQQAQVSLTEARIQAKQQLEQLKDAVKDAALNEQSASLAVQQAKYNQTLVDQNAYSTQLDRQQAALAVQQAEQQLTEAQQHRSNATEEASKKDRKYFDGQENVIQAEHALKDAEYGVAQAQQQLADAERNLTDTELNNADAIKAAQMAVAQAEQNAAYTQKRDAIAVQQAEQNVTDTLKEQRLQLAATRASSNQAAEQFTRDMARLTPAGRSFVNELLGMKGAYRGLESAAQNSVLPGMVIFLRGIHDLLPTIDRGVRRMGGAISTAFGEFGKQMQTPQFAHVLSGLMTEGVRFANIVLPAVAQFIEELARIGSQNGAVSGLAGLLAGIAHGLTGLAATLGRYEGPLNAFLVAVGKILGSAGPALGQMIGLFAKAIEPIMSFLDSGAGKPFVSMLGEVVAGFVAWKMAQKALFEPFGKLRKIPGQISSGWEKANDIYTKIMGPGGKVEEYAAKIGPVFKRAGELGSKVWTGLSDGAVAGGKWLAKFGSSAWSTMTSAGSAVASFVSGMATKLAEAATATGAWIAEHTVATATFIAENVAQAASATAAFIAENAATLGIAAGIAALVAGVIYLGTHWKQVWDGIKDIALDVWHNVLDPAWQGIAKGAEWLYDNAIKPNFQLIQDAFHDVASVADWLWHNVLDPVWQGIESGARSFVSGFETVWHRLESVFKTPVNFLIGTVYDKGIAKLWNDVVTHIGLSSIKLPVIPQMAGGGIVPGTDRGRDEQIVAMRPEEGVLVPEAVRGIGGPPAIHALNRAYGGGGRNKRGHFAEGGVTGKPSSSGGGGLGGWLSGIGHDIASGWDNLVDVGKIVAAVATGNTTAFVNAAGKLIGTNAAGDLAKVMVGVPKTLVQQAANQLVSMVAGSSGGKLPGGSTGAVGELPANWKTIAQFLSTRGFTKYAAAGVTGNVFAESGGDPEILEIGGGGGGGLIQWTPYPAGYITGDYQKDLYTQLNAILSWGGGPSLVNRGKSPSNAAQIYQDYYERPANLTASLPARMESANAVYQAMGWGKFDQGGWLMPAGSMPGESMPATMPVNLTGQPEAVLTPAESQAVVAWAKHQASQRGGAAAGTTVVQNFVGGGFPNAEQQAAMKREMALALSGP